MFDYVTSDLHLGHDNIIKYCNRPFQSVEDMDSTLINNWNTTISTSDDVLFLGDLAMADKEQTITYFNKLNGNIVFIRGNHDEKKLNTEIHVYDSIEFTHNGIVYVCTHRPEHPRNQTIKHIICMDTRTTMKLMPTRSGIPIIRLLTSQLNLHIINQSHLAK